MRLVAPDHSIKVSRTPSQPSHYKLGVCYDGPYVVLLILDRRVAQIPLTTVQAHKAGWDLLKTADDCIRTSHNGVLWDGHDSHESVVLTVNNQSLTVTPMKARKIAAALLRKSDFADDFQLQNNVRMVR